MFMQYIIIVAGILNLAMGVTVLSGAAEKKKVIPFVLFSFTTFVWAISNFFIYRVGGDLFSRLAYSLGALLVTFLISWAYWFIGRGHRKSISISIYLTGLLFAVLPLTGDLVVSTGSQGFAILEGPLYPVYVGYFVVGYAVVIARLLGGYHQAIQPDEKKRLRIILVGFSLYGAMSLLFSLILPALGIARFIDLDVPSSIIFVAFTTYAIVRYRWMNVKVILVEILAIVVAGVSLQEVFLAETDERRLYKIITAIIVSTMAVFTVRGVRAEVRRKEELQELSGKLAAANRELRRLDEARKEFVSIASHQLKTPLTGLKGGLSLVLEGSYGQIGPEVEAFLKKLYASNERVINLVEDLLNNARIESGKMEFKFAPTDIAAICREVTDTLLFKAKERKLYLKLNLPAERLPDLMIDGPKVREVISNIVDNAVKYTKSGGVTVKVERVTRNKALPDEGNAKVAGGGPDGYKLPPGDVVRITVSDTGIGIPKDELPYLFARFSRGKDTTRLNAGGTGLGLYVSRSMIEANGGRIWAESGGDGKGSRFVLELGVRGGGG